MSMDKEKVKEILSLHRLNRNLLWSGIIVTIGGTVGLIVKVINEVKPNNIELILIFIGILVIIMLFKLQSDLNKEIFGLLDQLDKK